MKKFSVYSNSVLLFVLYAAISSCSTGPANLKPGHEYAVTHTGDTWLGRRFSKAISKHPSRSGFYLLENGQQTLSMISYLIDHSERSLDLQYFIFHDDKTGKLVAHKLLKAADRGVKIRILLDDIFAISQEQFLTTLDSHPNISIKLYNRLSKKKWLRVVRFLTDFMRVNRRMHNKAFLADNQVAIIGGRNIGDAYYTAKKKFLFSDLDVVSVGPAVPEISTSFDEYWNAKWALDLPKTDSKYMKELVADSLKDIRKNYKRVMSSVYGRRLARQRMGEKLVSGQLPLVWANWDLLYDPPSKVSGLKKKRAEFVESRIIGYTKFAQSDVSVVSPYFIPSRFGMGWIKKLRKKDVNLSLVTNSFASNDTPVAHGGYRRYRKRLLKQGVTLYEFKPNAFAAERHDKAIWYRKVLPKSSLHAKALLIDNKYTFIGSVNLSPRSRYMNTEIVLVIHGSEMAGRMQRLFSIYRNPSNSYQVVLKKRRTFNDGQLKTENDVIWVTKEKGKPVVYKTEPDIWMLRDLGISIINILPIEGLL